MKLRTANRKRRVRLARSGFSRQSISWGRPTAYVALPPNLGQVVSITNFRGMLVVCAEGGVLIKDAGRLAGFLPNAI